MIYDWHCPLCDSDVRTEIKGLKLCKKIICPRCNMRYLVKANKDKIATLDIVRRSNKAPVDVLYCDWCDFYLYSNSMSLDTKSCITQGVGCCLLGANVEGHTYRKICNKAEAYDYNDIAKDIVPTVTSYNYRFCILCEDFNQANKVVDEIMKALKYYSIIYNFESRLTEHNPTDLERYPLRVTIIKEGREASIILEYGVFKVDDFTVYCYNFFYYLDTFKDELSPF